MFEEICRHQRGVVTRQQAVACGLTPEQIRARLRSGRWRRLFPGVYATFSGTPPRSAQLWAALLTAGDGAVLSHETAAELCGLLDAPRPAIHVTIPAARRVRRIPGMVVHISKHLDAARHPGKAPPQTRVEQTVLDLTQTARTLDQALSHLTRAVARRLTTVQRLRTALTARRKARWRAEINATLSDVEEGCHSPLELRYMHDVERAHGLPAGLRQGRRARRGGRWYDDVRYPSYDTLVEVDGRAAHPEDQRWRDLHRDNAGVAEGLSVLRYGAADVTTRACAVAAQVAGVLRRNGWTGQATPCGSDCPVRPDDPERSVGSGHHESFVITRRAREGGAPMQPAGQPGVTTSKIGTMQRHPNVQAVQDALDNAGARDGSGEACRVRLLPEAVHTAAAAATALDVEVGQIANSLIFDADGEPLLVLTSGAHRVDTARVAATLGVTGVRRATPEFVREHTGQPIGGVAPLGHPKPVRTLVDTALAGYDEIWAAGGVPQSIFATTYPELLRVTAGTPTAVA